ncbi:aspartyl/asparaginyl beta-hydroxylase domain-containing protein [Allosphingosinicella sp.]|jgi:mannose-6-phosphate isomerase-like protein (cupin superfamily)|uniref:aspartyl/asparaginyl beta-hydroxylase domain-containing protein n=1 Tax=Allosphingosinicella sp. TaxID=2823234 RepID=UPI002F196375
MRLTKPLLKLPKRFCAETLAAEVRALPPSAWVPHPGNYPGNDAVLLVTPQGQMTNAFIGPMEPTEHLLKCPYIMEVMADIGAVWGRSRLMGLAPGAKVPPHVDANYHWRTHTRVHIPVITTPEVKFTCGDDTVHMAPGECWVFDSFRPHRVHNGGPDKRVHLVLDTVGGEQIWDLVDRAQGSDQGSAGEPDILKPGERGIEGLAFEQVNQPRIMSPWEVRCHIAYIAEHVRPGARVEAVFRRLDRFASGWSGLWAQFGESEEGIPSYQRLIASLQKDLLALGGGSLLLRNEIPISLALTELIFRVALPAAAPVQTPPRRLAPAYSAGGRLAS